MSSNSDKRKEYDSAVKDIGRPTNKPAPENKEELKRKRQATIVRNVLEDYKKKNKEKKEQAPDAPEATDDNMTEELDITTKQEKRELAKHKEVERRTRANELRYHANRIVSARKEAIDNVEYAEKTP